MKENIGVESVKNSKALVTWALPNDTSLARPGILRAVSIFDIDSRGRSLLYSILSHLLPIKSLEGL
jgi:hypothetical protein